MKNKEIKILLVNDNKIAAESWKKILQTNPAFKVFITSEEIEMVLEKAKTIKPDIILVVMGLTPSKAYKLAETLAKNLAQSKVIGLSVYNLPRYANKMIELGARGYITKTSSLEEVSRGILEVYNGNIFICEEVKKNDPASN